LVEEQQPGAEVAEMIDIDKLQEFLRHADPNSEEYYILLELLAQERAKL